MDRDYIEREQIVARYVAGQLTDEERARFEEYCIAHPEIGRDIELERALRRGLQAAAERGWINHGRPRALWRRWLPAAAACLVLVGALAVTTWVLRDSRSKADALADATAHLANHGRGVRDSLVIALEPVRGAGSEPDRVIRLGDLPDHVVFAPQVVVLTCPDGTIDFQCSDGRAPSIPQYPRYRLELTPRAAPARAWRSGEQAPNEDGRIAFVLHSHLLEAGDYDLTVQGADAGGPAEAVGRFWLRVLPRS